MLHEDFNDSQRAASYLTCGLSRENPDAVVDVSLYPGGQAGARHMTVEVGHLEPVLERFCRRFPTRQVHVDYDFDHKDGLVGILRCACTHVGRGSCNQRCTCDQDRPRIIVRLHPADVPAQIWRPSADANVSMRH